jgi:FkbM family methyltransferase
MNSPGHHSPAHRSAAGGVEPGQNAADAPAFGAFAPSGFAAWALSHTRKAGDGWLSRRVAFLLRRLAIRSLRGRPLDVDAFGARMRLYPQTNICEKRVLFMPQLFDRAERAALEARVTDDYRFVDIGANVGVYSLFVAGRAGPRARILAVEPQPQVFNKLAWNIAQNTAGTIKAVACAVADKSGELTLFLDPRNEGESSVRVLRSSTARSVQVPAVTLLDLLTAEGFPRVDGMKVDVEGAEDLILEPFFAKAPESLWPKLLILEDSASRWGVDLGAILARAGYKLIGRSKLNFIYERAA